MTVGERFPRIVLATGNPHKLAELRAILEPLLPGVELVPYGGPSPVEDGATFLDNAVIKARAAHRQTGLPALADDSGIAVAALGGAPGIHSARYAGTGRDADNRALLLARMAGRTDRRAHFVCAAVLVSDGECFEAVAEWPGEVLSEPEGDGGFGYDPLFQPAGERRSAAAMSAAEKNEASHRALAFRALAQQLAP